MRLSIPDLRSSINLSGCIIIGAISALWLAQEIWAEASEVRVRAYASSLLNHAETVAGDITQALSNFDKRPPSRCSHEDLTVFKRAVFDFRFVRDIGQITNGQIICSAVWGELPTAFQLQGEGTITKNKVTLWHNIPSYALAGKLMDVSAKNDTFVVTAPTAFAPYESPSSELSATITSPDGKVLMRTFGIKENAQTRVERSTRICSERYDICVNASIDTSIISGDRLNLILIIGIIGAGLGVLTWHSVNQYNKSRKTLPAKLSRAIKHHRIEVAYQPIVQASTGQIRGFEALARWNDKTLGAVAPDDFIQLAAKLQISEALTISIISRALRECADTLRSQHELYLSLNLDTTDLRSQKILDHIEQTCSELGINKSQIVIELLETSTTELSLLQHSIDHLRHIGFQVFIDDFGTGYSNLSYLLQLKFDKIKIDKSLTQYANVNASADYVMTQIVNIANSIGAKIVFEGIETESQLEAIMQLDPTSFAQGWLFSKAIPIRELQAFIETNLSSTKNGITF